MTRIVSVWLKAWPIARFLRAQARAAASGSRADAVDPARPFALVAAGPGGPRLAALDEAAERAGLVVGELLSNARSKVRELQSRDADPEADDRALRRLALWGLRYTPLVAPWGAESGADGLFLDITGCAHLLGGEKALLADLGRRLEGFGLAPRLAVADTAAAAWAVARYAGRRAAIVPPGGAERAIAALPPAALRLPEATRLLLARLGFRRIGDLLNQPRAPLGARFGALFLSRLDQALGRVPEPLSPILPPPAYRARAQFLEAIGSVDHVVEAARRLFASLAAELERAGAGARRLRLLLFRVDGGVATLSLGLAAPSRDAGHVAGLVRLRLERAGLDAGFGFEAAALHVLAAEPMAACQSFFALTGLGAAGAGLGPLVDRLAQRLGAGAVRRLVPRESHIPERAIAALPAGEVAGMDAPLPEGPPRPLLVLPKPEAAEVLALVPEGPPRQFRWRGVLRQIAHAEGPERIAPEWWRGAEGDRTRDYYLVEDSEGRRFWLFRAGLYGRDEGRPCWFVHGLFA